MDKDPVRQERTKLTASYLNTIAGSLFTARTMLARHGDGPPAPRQMRLGV